MFHTIYKDTFWIWPTEGPASRSGLQDTSPWSHALLTYSEQVWASTGRRPKLGSPHLPFPHSSEHSAQRTCVEGGGTENRRCWRAAFSIAGAVTGPGELSPGWLVTGTQLRTSALVLWNLDVTNLKCTTVNYTVNHLFNNQSRKDISHPTPNLFSHHQITCLKPWEGVGRSTQPDGMFQLSFPLDDCFSRTD